MNDILNKFSIQQFNNNKMKNKLSISQFQDLRQIGHGAFGKVYQATFKTTGKVVALKKISKKQIKVNNMMTQISNQIQISKKLQHSNIVKLYQYFDDQNDIFLVLELAAGGQLYSKLMKYGRFAEQQTKRMVKQIISAVKYLHQNKIIHRDIKPENILLDKKGNVKLADFGWSNFTGGDKPRKTYCGTVDYLAPQMIDKSGHDESLDIWCLGVLVFQLLTGKTPFVSQNAKGPQKKKIIQQNILNMNINFPNDFPILAKSFVLGMIKRNPKQRFTLQDIQKHQWLKQKIQQKTQQLQPYMNKKQTKDIDVIDISSSENQIIQKLKKRNKQLQQEVSLLKFNNQMKQQYKSQNNQQEINSMMKELRRLKPFQQKLLNLQKDYDELWENINKKDKQIILFKSQLKRIDDIKQQCQRLKSDKKKYQDKSKKHQKQILQLRNKQSQLTEQLNKISSTVSTKVKTGFKLTNSDVSTPQFAQYIQEELQNLGFKFEQAKKILLKVLQRQKIQKEKQDQLGRLRAQQKQMKEILKMELKQQFQNEKDQILIVARKQLSQQRERWMNQRQKLKKIFQQGININGNVDIGKDANKQQDLELQLQTIKQLNSFYQKTISQQNFRIKDLQSELKRKK